MTGNYYRWSRVVIFFITGLLFIGCIHGSQYDDARKGFLLKYRAKKGDVLKYETCIMGKETYKRNEREKNVNIIEESLIKFEVTSVNKDGDIEMLASYEKFSSGYKGKGKFKDIDCSGFIGKKVRLELSKKGIPKKVELLDKFPEIRYIQNPDPKTTFEGFFPRFKDVRVRLGQSWGEEFSQSYKMSYQKYTGKVKITYKLVGIEIGNGAKALKILARSSINFKAHGTSKGKSPFSCKGKRTAIHTIYCDYENGLILKALERYKVKVLYKLASQKYNIQVTSKGTQITMLVAP